MGKGVVSVKTHIPLVENPIPDSPYVIPDPKSAKGPAFPTSNSIDMFDAMSSRPSELTAALARRYSIDREIGQGGMATVYLAEDMKHHRQVAVKVLRPELAAILGGERFLKEIEVTAGLQHPNILPLYDSGEAASFLYYVMPYLEGESLRDKLNRETQLGLEETVQLAREISGALQFAHDRGVVHRDIKPENILLQAGQALVADFGIALAVSQAGGTRLTETGLSLGTPHYVSPEQATGDRDVDSRSDVYSLGAMVYEMLTGEPPHTGNTMQAIVAKVLTDTPIPISRTRNLVPANVEAAVQRALAKSPADRFTDADGFAAALINPNFTIPTVESSLPSPQRRSLWNPLSAATTLTAVFAIVIAALALSSSPPPDQVLRFGLVLGEDEGLVYTGAGNLPRLALLPDGSGIVYAGVNRSSTGDGRTSVGRILWYRDFSQLESRMMAGTDGAWVPTVSPDGERVAFLVRGTDADGLKVVLLAGGPPILLTDSGIGSAPTWGEDNQIYFFDDTGLTLKRVPASGGTVETVVEAQSTGRRYNFPTILPGGRTAVATAFRVEQGADRPTGTQVDAVAGLEVHGLNLETGSTNVVVQGFSPAYSGSGHLLYVTPEGTIMAAGFDPSSAQLTGRPAALLAGIEIRGSGYTDLTVSHNGVMAYATVGINTPEQIVWVDRNGSPTRVDPNWTRDEEFEGIAISPDGRRLAVEIVTAGRSDIWIKQLDTGPLSRLTFAGVDNLIPTWTPDGNSVAFASIRSGTQIAYSRRSDGAGGEELVLDLDRDIVEVQWTHDGAWLVAAVSGPPSDDIFALRAGSDEPIPILAERHDEFEPAISPDGQWLAYVSDESGLREVYVRPFPNVNDGRWLISTDGGKEPVWSASGRELFYRSIDNTVVFAADMSSGPATATRRVLFELPAGNDYESNPRNRLIDVAPDGRFLMVQRTGSPDISGDLIIVRRFDRELGSTTN